MLGNTEGSEWGDARPIADVTSRVSLLVRGLDSSLSEEDAKGLVAKCLSIKRIGRLYGDGRA